ncbi:uncharacterized protein [Heliangelus exortis]|uniref:uncharacterized protein isoform X2 n=1 Tax=Heliangelus exortis TaxID=472823 RepID=UPI003A92F8D1
MPTGSGERAGSVPSPGGAFRPLSGKGRQQRELCGGSDSGGGAGRENQALRLATSLGCFLPSWHREHGSRQHQAGEKNGLCVGGAQPGSPAPEAGAAGGLRRAAERGVGEEPGLAAPHAPALLGFLPHLPAAATETGSHRGPHCSPCGSLPACGSRPAVPRGWPAPRPLCGERGGGPGAEGPGLRAAANGGHRAVGPSPGLWLPAPHHPRQAALLCPPGLCPGRASAERGLPQPHHTCRGSAALLYPSWHCHHHCRQAKGALHTPATPSPSSCCPTTTLFTPCHLGKGCAGRGWRAQSSGDPSPRCQRAAHLLDEEGHLRGRGLHPSAGPAGSWQHRMVPALALWACLTVGTASKESPAPGPLAGGQPFAVVWNIPTSRCQHRFGVELPLGDYGIVENQDGHFVGQNITIFYKNKFGLYPYLTRQGIPLNGGIPQRVPLSAHLSRVAGDIHLLLRPTFRGLAVVDWEEWRPLWAQNWGAKRIYRVASEQWVQDRHSLMPAQRRLRLAQWEFEQAAQALMEETLLLGRTLHPKGLWGFYRFPDCLNGNWAKEANYTGQCRPAEVQRNNQLGWLWAASAALYPSIYLPPALPPALRRLYVHHRLREALRVAAFGTSGLLPVVAYSRLSFRRSPRFLEPADLVHTIGESAALGAAGLVLWGDMSYSHSALCQPAPLPRVHPGSLRGQCDSSSPGVQLQAVPWPWALCAPPAP